MFNWQKQDYTVNVQKSLLNYRKSLMTLSGSIVAEMGLISNIFFAMSCFPFLTPAQFFSEVDGLGTAAAIAQDPLAKPNRKYAVCCSATRRNGNSDPLCKPNCSFFLVFFS